MHSKILGRALAFAIVLVGGVSLAVRADDDGAPGGWKKGALELESIGPLGFGADGILFIADPLAARIIALATGDTKAGEAKPIAVEGLDGKVASLLGTKSSEIEIVDLAVNPATGNAFISVARGRGPEARPALVRIQRESGELSLVDLSRTRYASAALPDAPGPDEVDRRQQRKRLESITDVQFVDGRVIVAGLSNEAFSSTLRSIPFPFEGVGKGTSVEVYHGAHGRFETNAPVRTFVAFDIEEKPHVIAAYTCTPLVKFPLSDLEPGVHLKGTTIAELGNRNRPLDMIAYEKEGESWILLANSSRGVMKIGTKGFGSETPIVDKVDGTKGVGYETMEDWTGIHQLDKLDGSHALIVRRDDAGAFHLETRDLP